MRYIISLLTILFLSSLANAAYVFNSRGWVEYKKEGTSQWKRVSSRSRLIIKEGDQLRTKRASTVQIYMDDGSKIQLAPRSSFKLRAENKKETSLGLFFGRIRSWVKKRAKKFEVRTPSAVCAVRGTDFSVAADASGNTRVEVYGGSVMTGDASGKSVLVKPGEVVSVNAKGLGKVKKNPAGPASMESAIGEAKLLAKKELYNEISKESVLKAAQAEMQSAEYKARKVAIDAYGYRVRMEEYVIRPQTDQFKYVVLNSRDDRFDFGKMIFTFNKDLPKDLSLATENMISSTADAAPEWYLTDMNSIMSNTQDKVTENATGGAMVESSDQWSLVFNEYSFYAAGP
ncbi:MAG: FecR domain-containing protein, partial [Elusimicrobiales bacterium]|nr:FecR domain-containing protein [Elusimicrobiales bacterium]